MLQMDQVFADAEAWQHMTGWSSGWMVLGWLFWLSVIVLVVWAVGRAKRGTLRERGAEQILAGAVRRRGAVAGGVRRPATSLAPLKRKVDYLAGQFDLEKHRWRERSTW